MKNSITEGKQKMWKKIKRALIEDRLISSINKGIRDRWKRLLKRFDIWSGTCMRIKYMNKLPINPQKVFFMTFQGDYTCNPKYISEELLRQKVECDIVWAKGDGTNSEKSKKVNRKFPEQVRTVEKNSQEFFEEIATSKIIIINALLFKTHEIKLKKGQILLQTWHGSLGIKRIGKEDKKDDLLWITGIEKTADMTRYVLSNSTFENRVYRDTYWNDDQIVMWGHARNDIFFDINGNKCKRKIIKDQIFEKYEITNNTNIILYAPTFRNSKNFECYDIDVEGILSSVTEKWGGNWVIMLRYHPTIKSIANKNNKIVGERIIDVTNYPDMQDLIVIADIGITDYSSWIYDFILLRKPGFIFATDIAEYDTERGFYYPLKDTPFPVAVNNKEMINNIKAFDQECYIEKLESFLKEKGCIDNGHAAEKVVDYICHEINLISPRKYIIEKGIIAHALGNIDGRVYTNSKEAFEYSYNQGIRLFEVDLRYTSDKKIVCVHGWNKDDYLRLGLETEEEQYVKKDYNAFMNVKLCGKYTPLDLYQLLKIMENYEDTYWMLDFGIRTPLEDISDIYIEIVKQADEKVLKRIISGGYHKNCLETIDRIYKFPLKNFYYEPSLIDTEYGNKDRFVKFLSMNNIFSISTKQKYVSEQLLKIKEETGVVLFAFGDVKDSLSGVDECVFEC